MIQVTSHVFVVCDISFYPNRLSCCDRSFEKRESVEKEESKHLNDAQHNRISEGQKSLCAIVTGHRL